MSSGLRWKPRSLPAAELLLRAAADRFARRGYHGTTIEAVARQAGVNKALVSYHFGGKEQLYLAIRRRLLLLLTGMDPASPRPARGQDPDLQTWIEEIARQARQVPALPLFLLREQLGDGPSPAGERSILEILATHVAERSGGASRPDRLPPPEGTMARARVAVAALLFHLAQAGPGDEAPPLPLFLAQWLTS